MPRSYPMIYASALLTTAFEDACRKLGIEPAPSDATNNEWIREQLAAAILNGAKLGVINPAVLSDLAVAFGMRNWHLSRA
jgi:hypothetical protein